MGIPTEEDIAKLPIRAQVAFAARCALRVFPLFKARDQNRDYVGEVRQAIETVVHWAGMGPYNPASKEARATARYFTLAASRAARVGAHAAARAAAFAASEAASAVRAVRTDETDSTLPTSHIVDAARAARATKAHGIVGAIRRDFDTILELANSKGWNNSTPVIQSVFGPMWPRGHAKPKWAEHDSELMKDSTLKRKATKKKTEKKKTTKTKPPQTNNTASRADESMQRQLEKQLEDKVSAAEEKFAELTKSISALEKKRDDLAAEVSNAKSTVAEGVANAQASIEAAIKNTEGTLEEIETDARQKSKQIKEEVTTRAFDQPLLEWSHRKRRHDKSFRICAITLTSLAVAFLLVAFGVFWLVYDEKTTWSNIAPWQYAQIIILIAVVFAAMRLITRLLMTHRHISIDAEERMTLIATYTRLSRAGRVTDVDRQFLMTTLFRPTHTGLIKDEGVLPEASRSSVEAGSMLPTAEIIKTAVKEGMKDKKG